MARTMAIFTKFQSIVGEKLARIVRTLCLLRNVKRVSINIGAKPEYVS